VSDLNLRSQSQISMSDLSLRSQISDLLHDSLPANPRVIASFLVCLVSRQRLLVSLRSFVVGFFVPGHLRRFWLGRVTGAHETVTCAFVGYRIKRLPELLHSIHGGGQIPIDAGIVTGVEPVNRRADFRER